MHIDRVEKAIFEAERFLSACKEMKKNHVALGKSQEEWAKLHPGTTNYWKKDLIDPGKHTGAVKRASMDLSRALVALRHP